MPTLAPLPRPGIPIAARIPDDDHALFIGDDRLVEAELLDPSAPASTEWSFTRGLSE